MSRMKVPAPNGVRKEPPNSASGQFQPTPSDLPQPPLANYTLPGVISYLTSEFTNLERFKIMTNLEKSEMRFRIQQLTAEVNSLRFLNDKQAVRIQELEQNLAAVSTPTATKEGDKKNEAEEKLLSKVPDASEAALAAPITEIPLVDLDVLRLSRQQLERAVRDVFRLLNVPSAATRSVLDVPGAEIGTGDYLELLKAKGPTEGERAPEKEHSRPRGDVFSSYMLESADLLDADADALELPERETVEVDAELPLLDKEPSTVPLDTAEALHLDSDAETVIVSDFEEAEPEKTLHLGISAVLSANSSSSVFHGSRHRFCTLHNDVLASWLRGKCLWEMQITDTDGESGLYRERDENGENGENSENGILSHSSAESHIVGAFPLDRFRAVVVRSDGLALVQVSDDTAKHTLLVQSDDLVISCASLVEKGRGQWGLACGGKDKDGSCVVVWELHAGVSGSSEPGSSGPFASPNPITTHEIASFQNIETEITSVCWSAPEAPAADWTGYSVVYVHGTVLKASVVSKETSVAFRGQATTAEVSGPYMLVEEAQTVSLVDVASTKVISSHTAFPGASYALLYKEKPYIVELLVDFRVYDLQFSTVAEGEGAVVACDLAFLVTRTRGALKVTAVEL